MCLRQLHPRLVGPSGCLASKHEASWWHRLIAPPIGLILPPGRPLARLLPTAPLAQNKRHGEPSKPVRRALTLRPLHAFVTCGYEATVVQMFYPDKFQ